MHTVHQGSGVFSQAIGMKTQYIFLFALVAAILPDNSLSGELIWPIDCVPGEKCSKSIGYPDLDNDGKAFNCKEAGYQGHQGTDIRVSSLNMILGVDVYAAADGEVLWVFDGKFDECPDSHKDCQDPPAKWFEAGQSRGYRVCTELGPYCDAGGGSCFWCFDGGNVVVIRHENTPGIFATRYDHFKTGSITVKPGDKVKQGQKIGQVGSAGRSTGPHLHFEVWDTGFYKLADPWSGKCGTNKNESLWKNNPPWKK